MGHRRLSCLLLALLAASAPADACPVCDRETGRRVRAGLADEDLGRNVLATALPFGIFLGVAAALHFGLPARRGGPPGPGPATGPESS
ncbi:hypothetical protein [Tautonia plasticadhaerens]|uniref:Uncharacterized protein n=1 Tax=Tautonia plasticadhaerens TaxID=2527974 RepID=A0A518GUN0_9BACT|nr:hypothetical protein [Tautonia plasticadhaerens]QDV32296.1 hypothetical protein ElP_01240 [Tautonia plasticadhaerens]